MEACAALKYQLQLRLTPHIEESKKRQASSETQGTEVTLEGGRREGGRARGGAGNDREEESARKSLD